MKKAKQVYSDVAFRGPCNRRSGTIYMRSPGKPPYSDRPSSRYRVLGQRLQRFRDVSTRHAPACA